MGKDIKEYDLLSSVIPHRVYHFVKASGAALIDEQGKEYLDLNEMCQVLGQSNENYIQAMTEALHGITSHKVGFSSAKEELYQWMIDSTDGYYQGIHLTSSGSEAVEWAVRLAKHMTGRSEAISFWNSIHGRTYLSASMSGLPRRKAGHGPLAPGVILVPYPRCGQCPQKDRCKDGFYPCLELAKEHYHYASAQDAAAVIVEPYQGARIDMAPAGYMKALFDWTKQEGMLFILDENQSGVGRSGVLYNYKRLGIQPDMLLLGKGLGNGFHISAILTREVTDKEALNALTGGVGDDTLACASACQVYRQLDQGLLDHVREVSEVLAQGLKKLECSESVLEVRSIGLAAAVEFYSANTCAEVCKQLEEAGFFVGHAGNCLTVKPPYVITGEQIERFTKTLAEIITLVQ